MGRKTRTRWEATALPWIAGALGASERIYQTSIDALPPVYSEHPSRPYMRRFADQIGGAELYWLSRTAATVATDLAGHGMPPVTFRELIATSDLPATGLMLWPKPLASLPWTNHRVQDPDAEAMTAGWDGLAWIYDDREFSTFLLSQVAEQRAAGVLSDVRPTWSPGQVVRFDSLALDSFPGSGETLVPINEPMDEFGAVLPSVSQVVARVPGQPAAVYVYTDDDRDEAARYAETVGGTVVPLPLAPPAGYTKGPDGSLVPIALAIEGRSRAEPSPTRT